MWYEDLIGKYNLQQEHVDFLKDMTITQEESDKILNYDQRTDDWHKARSNRITASRFGEIAGNNKYQTDQAVLVQDLLWKTFQGNAATEWGTLHEPDALAEYENTMKKHWGPEFTVTQQGLYVPVDKPWLGVSVDGLVYNPYEKDPNMRLGGIEIKCPFRKKFYPSIPAYYYDQIQGTMGILKRPWWDFVTWTPTQTKVERFLFNEEYYTTSLYPKLEEFYMTVYMPQLILRKQNKIHAQDIKPIIM